MLQFYIRQIVVRHFSFIADHLKCALLGSESRHIKESDRPIPTVKILTVMIRVHDRRAECCLDGMYTVLWLIVNFKQHACKKWTPSLKLVVIYSAVSFLFLALRPFTLEGKKSTEIIIIMKFIVQSTRRNHCESSPGLSNECRTMPSDHWPTDQANWLRM